MKTVLSMIFCIGPTLLATPCVSQTVSEEMEITTIQQQAIEGDREAQFQLAECYRTGKELEQNWELAYQWYKKSAEQDYTPAMHALSVCLMDGYGTEKKPQDAIRIVTICAERGYIKSIRALIAVYMQGLGGNEKNPDIAKKWAQIGAELGDAKCTSTLGEMMVSPSFGINQQEEGIKLLKKAAEGGAKRAAYLLGGIFLYGDCGQTINYVEARHWLSLASEQNHADATFLLAIIYYKGLGVEHDLEKCAQLCLKSAQLGNGEARLTVALMYAKGEGLPEVPEHAIYWAKKAVDQGEPGAERIYQTLLLYSYEGNYIIPDTLPDININLH